MLPIFSTARFRATAPLLLGLLGAGAPAQVQAQRVGIGTTAPHAQAALEIAASNKGLLIPRLDSVQRAAIPTPPQGLLVYQKDGRAGLWYYQGGQWKYLQAGSQADNLGNHTATRNLGLNGYWLSNGTTNNGLRIDNGGRVGINTSAGTAALEVVRTASSDATATFQGSFYHSHFNYGTRQDTYLRGGYDNSRVIIADNGNAVGVGTANPTYPLHVVNTIGTSGATAGFTFHDRTDATQQFTWYARDGRATLWHSTGGELLTMTNTGRLGVNLTNPTQHLEVGANVGPEQQVIATAASTLRISDGAPMFQTFKAVYTGQLTRLALSGTGPWGSSTLTLYEGAAPIGAPIFTTTNTFGAAGWVEHSVNVAVVTGRTYCVRLSNCNGWSLSPDNYPDGASSNSSAQDFGLRVWQASYLIPVFAVQTTGVTNVAQLSVGSSGAVTTISPDGTLAAASHTALPTQQAVKTYVDARVATSQNLTLSGATLSISGGTSVTLPDASTTNELQTISKAGNTVTLSNGGGTFTDADNQTLGISGTTITLTNGGSVTVPSSADNLGTHTASQNVKLNGNWLSNDGGAEGIRIDNSGNVGIGTATPAAHLDISSGEVRLPGGGGGSTHFNYAADNKNYIRGTTIIADGGGTVSIGATGTPLVAIQKFTVNYDVGVVTANSCVDYPILVPGLEPGAVVTVTPGAILPTGLAISGTVVPSSGLLMIRFCKIGNGSADPGAMDFYISAIR